MLPSVVEFLHSQSTPLAEKGGLQVMLYRDAAKMQLYCDIMIVAGVMGGLRLSSGSNMAISHGALHPIHVHIL